MIEYKTGDIFAEDVEALVAPVNCEGVMGRGLARQFKKNFPKNSKEYERAEIKPGSMFVFDTREFLNPKYIINFPTKRGWRGKSRMEDIESGLASLVKEIQGRHIRSIAIPALGCGLGGLPWREVRERMEAKLKPLAEADVEIVIFEPKEDSEAERQPFRGGVPNLTTG